MRAIVIALALAGIAAPAMAQDFDLMALADTDKDAKVSLAEYTAFAEMAWGFLAQGADKVKLSDVPDQAKPIVAGYTADKDGNLTHAAFTAAQPARFKAADKNSDGSLNAAELLASLNGGG